MVAPSRGNLRTIESQLLGCLLLQHYFLHPQGVPNRDGEDGHQHHPGVDANPRDIRRAEPRLWRYLPFGSDPDFGRGRSLEHMQSGRNTTASAPGEVPVPAGEEEGWEGWISVPMAL